MADNNDFFDIEQKENTQKEDSDPGRKLESAAYQDFVTQYLLANNLITERQLHDAIRLFKKEKKGRMFGEILISIGAITEKMLSKILHSFKGISKFDLNKAALDKDLITKVPKNFAVTNKIIPITLIDSILYVAMHNIYDIMRADKIRRYFPMAQRIVPVYSNEPDILTAIDKYYGYEMSIDAIIKEIADLELDVSAVAETVGKKYQHPIIRLIDAFLVDAIKMGASDIHFEPCEFFLRIRYRVDGVLLQRYTIDNDIWESMLIRIKVISGMDITEKRHTQDGRLSITISARDIDIRLSTQPTIYGENCVMRILDASSSVRNLEKLGIDKFNLGVIDSSLARPEGIIIITGPTGSGKTTTLYAMISKINKMGVNIMTMEDPVEYRMPLIRQSNIASGGHGGMSFEEALRGAMRQDPDIIFLGEVRDEITAKMAVRAAMTGHKVFTSLHTNDAISAIPRLQDMNIEPAYIASSVTSIMAQRLARRLCDYCKKESKLTEKERIALNISKKKQYKIYEHNSEGCKHCNNGYKGRILIMEVLFVDNKLRRMINNNKSYSDMNHYIKKLKNFIPMKKCAKSKLLSGEIDIEELIRTVNIAEDMVRADIKIKKRKKNNN